VKRPIKQAQPATKLSDHIRELKKRVFVSVIALVAAGSLVYVFYAPLIELLRSPLGIPLYYNTPAGSFSFIIRVCLTGSLAIAMPVLVYNLIMFAQPAFPNAVTKKRVYLAALMSSVLAIAGAVFAFTCILPGTLHFFAGYQIGGITALISADSYLNFVINIIVTFILVFQLPLLISFIDIIKPLKPKKLFSYEKWVILGSLIISLVVPFSYDIITSLMVALPIIVLFNLSIVIVLMRHSSESRKARASAKATLIAARNSTEIIDLPLDYFSFEDLSSQPEEVAITFNPDLISSRSHRAGMDIVSTKKPPVIVEPAEWYVRKHQPIEVDPRHRRISDFQVMPGTNRVSA
jgi:sec-independent protein translocase protein TatC